MINLRENAIYCFDSNIQLVNRLFNNLNNVFSGQTAFSGQVFAPLKNPLNAVAEGFRKNLEKKFSNFEVIVFMVYFLVRKVVIEV